MNRRVLLVGLGVLLGGCDDEVVGYAEMNASSGQSATDQSTTGSTGDTTTTTTTTTAPSSSSSSSSSESGDSENAETGDEDPLPDFVAIGFEFGLAVSHDDGASWTTIEGIEDTQEGQESIARGTDKIVVVGASRTLVTEDGLTWTSFNDASLGYGRAAAFGNGVFVNIGQDRLSWSEDAFGWIDARNGESGFNYWDVAFGNGRFVAVGSSALATSTDGKTWTRTELGGPKLTTVAYGNGRFIALGDEGRLAITEDGSTLLSDTLGEFWFDSICLYAGEFHMVGSGAVRLSEDGDQWREFAMPDTSGIGCGPTSLVSFGEDIINTGADVFTLEPAHTMPEFVFAVTYTGAP